MELILYITTEQFVKTFGRFNRKLNFNLITYFSQIV